MMAGEKYDDVLLPFLSLMRKELHANSGKGDRPGWLRMDVNTALLEVYWHAAKLSVAVKNNDGPAIMEHAADVANMAMMVLDRCDGIAWIDYAPGVQASDKPGIARPAVKAAAEAEGLHFVSRSHGLTTTDTVSLDTLTNIVRAAACVAAASGGQL